MRCRQGFAELVDEKVLAGFDFCTKISFIFFQNLNYGTVPYLNPSLFVTFPINKDYAII